MQTIDAPRAGQQASDMEDEFDTGISKADEVDIRRQLHSATSGPDQFLSKETAEKWLAKAMKQQDPLAYFEEEIVPKMERLLEVRKSFDATTEGLEDYPETKSFKRLAPFAFWKLTPKERREYLSKATEFMKQQSVLKVRLKKLQGETFHSFVQATHGRLKASSDRDIAKLREGLKHVSLDAGEIAGWEKFLKEAVGSAQSLYGRMMNMLITAQVSNHAISERVVKGRKDKFQDTSIDFKVKETFINEELPVLIKEWTAVKEDRDLLARNPRIHELKGKVQGLEDFLSDTKFPDLLYPRRKALVAEVDAALDTLVDEMSSSDVAANVRRSLSMRDYEGALLELSEAKKNGIDEAELKRLEEYVQQCMATYDTSVEGDIDVEAEAETIRGLVGTYPASLQNMYQECLQESPREAEAGPDISKSLKGLESIVYNRIWVHEHRYSNKELDRKNAASEENKERTRDYMEDGHSRTMEHNIIGGDTANTAAIRGDNTKAQILHMKPDGWRPVLDKVKEHGDNWDFRYWVTLHPTDLSYEKQRTIVKSDHARINSALRKIYKAGYRYTKSGALVPLASSTTEKKETKLQGAPVLAA